MIAFIFSGQGAQKPGMGREIAGLSAAAKDVYNTVSIEIGRSMEKLCFDASLDQLNQTINTQPAMFSTDVAMMAALIEKEINPELCAGFSLGEYAALVCSGALSLATAAKIVDKRAKIMSECQNGGMMAVLGVEAKELEKICEEIEQGYVIPVNYNCPGQIVVAGENNALAALQAILKERKMRAIQLSVSAAFHSEMMADAADKIYDILEGVVFAKPQIPIFCNVTAKPFDESISWREMLALQAKSPVLWEQTIRNMIDQGATAFVECGVGKVLAGFNKRICPTIPTYYVQDAASLEEAVRGLQNI